MATRRLLADIGGTNARFALSGRNGRPSAEKTLRTADYRGPVEAVRAYLGDREVDEAVFAMALPVSADWVQLTNSPWAFSIEQTRQALGLARLTVINDFSAQALAVPALTAKERLQIGDGEPVEGAAIGVIGPGTGLGVGGLLRIGHRWHPVASEGGHVSLAPRDEVDAAVWARLRERFGHVSNERVLSGPGLVNLATAIAAIAGEELRIDDPKEVSRRAEAGCRFCRAALDRFSGLLGAAAGDLALTLCAQGGVYIGGGLVKRLGSLFDAGGFRASFVAKGRFEDYLRAVPTYLVTRRDPGLLGAAVLQTS
ncbi:MAG TPA: glucokinase [Geminicoccaceae bacterium]|nr:glucokinase [Geminicoccaceae bacterium]